MALNTLHRLAVVVAERRMGNAVDAAGRQNEAEVLVVVVAEGLAGTGNQLPMSLSQALQSLLVQIAPGIRLQIPPVTAGISLIKVARPLQMHLGRWSPLPKLHPHQ